MSKRPFVLGILTGLVLSLALGFGALTLAGGTSVAGTPLRFGDAVRGALARRDASPATGARAMQSTDAETGAAADATAGGDAQTDDDAADGCLGGMASFAAPVMELHELEMIDGEAVVAGVEEGSAAEAAGLGEGDVITAIDGEAVESADTLATAIGDRAPGETVALTIESADGETREVSATLGAHPEDPERGFLGVMLGRTISIEAERLPQGLHRLPGGGQWFGKEGTIPFSIPGLGDDDLHFELDRARGLFDLDELEILAVDGRLSGAIVHDFTGDGPAESAGLTAGDVITAVDGEPVGGSEDLVAALEGRSPGEMLALTVARKGQTELLTIEATLGARPEDAAAGWLGVEVGTLEMRFDGDGGVEAESHMGTLRDHLRDMLRGDGDASIIEGEDAPRRFRMRIGPGGASEPADVTLDLDDEA